jgi:TorA maturation chaperone TorD
MGGLVGKDFAVSVEHQRHFFDRHLAPWIGRFFADLEAKAADFYRPVGAIGRLFIDIETEAFALPG